MKLIFPIFILVYSLSTFSSENPIGKLTQQELVELNLTDQDYQTIAIGEIGNARYITSGLLGIYPGFGIGHIVQRRWRSDGWKFTLGEGVGAIFFYIGAIKCIGDSLYGRGNDCNSQYLTAGAAIFFGFKIWEGIDIWHGGIVHRRRYNELTKQIKKKIAQKTSIYFSPIIHRANRNLGFGLSFRY